MLLLSQTKVALDLVKFSQSRDSDFSLILLDLVGCLMDSSSKLRMWASGELPLPSMFQTMNIIPIHVEDGFAQITATPDDQHMNTTGNVHGGYLATVMDTVTGFAVNSALTGGSNAVTIDLQTKMLRSPPPNKTYYAEGKVISVGRTIASSEGKMFDDEGVVYAWGCATFRVFRKD